MSCVGSNSNRQGIKTKIGRAFCFCASRLISNINHSPSSAIVSSVSDGEGRSEMSSSNLGSAIINGN